MIDTIVRARLLVTLAAGAGLFSLCVPAHAADSSWSVSKKGSEVVVTDCDNCGEETQIVMSCAKGGKLARVIVNGAASDKGSAGQISPVVFNVSGERFTYNAKTMHFGEQGYMPVFIMIPDDPIIDWLQASKNGTATFNGKTASFGLSGSENALDRFRKLCGWNQAVVKNNPQFTASFGEDADTHIPDYSQTVEVISPALPDADGRFWHTGDGFGGGSARTLSYSLTDSMGELISASCKTFGDDQVTLKTSFDLAERKDGDGVILEVLHDAGVSTFTGKVIGDEEAGSSAQFAVSADDAMWNSLAFSPGIVMRLRGGQPITLNGMTGAAALREFTHACTRRIEATQNNQENFIFPNITIGLK